MRVPRAPARAPASLPGPRVGAAPPHSSERQAPNQLFPKSVCVCAACSTSTPVPIPTILLGTVSEGVTLQLCEHRQPVKVCVPEHPQVSEAVSVECFWKQSPCRRGRTHVARWLWSPRPCRVQPPSLRASSGLFPLHQSAVTLHVWSRLLSAPSHRTAIQGRHRTFQHPELPQKLLCVCVLMFWSGVTCPSSWQKGSPQHGSACLATSLSSMSACAQAAGPPCVQQPPVTKHSLPGWTRSRAGCSCFASARACTLYGSFTQAGGRWVPGPVSPA